MSSLSINQSTFDRIHFYVLSLLVLIPLVVLISPTDAWSDIDAFTAGCAHMADEQLAYGDIQTMSDEQILQELFDSPCPKKWEPLIKDIQRLGGRRSLKIFRAFFETGSDRPQSKKERLIWPLGGTIGKMARDGSRPALEYLKLASSLEYWIPRVAISEENKQEGWTPRRFAASRTRDFSLFLGCTGGANTKAHWKRLIGEFVPTDDLLVYPEIWSYSVRKCLFAEREPGLDRLTPNIDPKVDAELTAYFDPEVPARGRCVPPIAPYFEDKLNRELWEILEDPSRKEDWAKALLAIGRMGASPERDFQRIAEFLENRFSGEVDDETFQALATAPIAMAMLPPRISPGKDGRVRSKDWRENWQKISQRANPGYWRKNKVRWTFHQIQGETQELYLAQLFIKTLPLRVDWANRYLLDEAKNFLGLSVAAPWRVENDEFYEYIVDDLNPGNHREKIALRNAAKKADTILKQSNAYGGYSLPCFGYFRDDADPLDYLNFPF
ncbi:MAG: hypothetical protein H6684_08330 [Deltaproteobacteria bacterium]|nr:hypothetical protein [Deltaproteobacteria bacterium]